MNQLCHASDRRPQRGPRMCSHGATTRSLPRLGTTHVLALVRYFQNTSTLPKTPIHALTGLRQGDIRIFVHSAHKADPLSTGGPPCCIATRFKGAPLGCPRGSDLSQRAGSTSTRYSRCKLPDVRTLTLIRYGYFRQGSGSRSVVQGSAGLSCHHHRSHEYEHSDYDVPQSHAPESWIREGDVGVSTLPLLPLCQQSGRREHVDYGAFQADVTEIWARACATRVVSAVLPFLPFNKRSCTLLVVLGTVTDFFGCGGKQTSTSHEGARHRLWSEWPSERGVLRSRPWRPSDRPRRCHGLLFSAPPFAQTVEVVVIAVDRGDRRIVLDDLQTGRRGWWRRAPVDVNVARTSLDVSYELLFPSRENQSNDDEHFVHDVTAVDAAESWNGGGRLLGKSASCPLHRTTTLYCVSQLGAVLPVFGHIPSLASVAHSSWWYFLSLLSMVLASTTLVCLRFPTS